MTKQAKQIINAKPQRVAPGERTPAKPRTFKIHLCVEEPGTGDFVAAPLERDCSGISGIHISRETFRAGGTNPNWSEVDLVLLVATSDGAARLLKSRQASPGGPGVLVLSTDEVPAGQRHRLLAMGADEVLSVRDVKAQCRWGDIGGLLLNGLLTALKAERERFAGVERLARVGSVQRSVFGDSVAYSVELRRLLRIPDNLPMDSARLLRRVSKKHRRILLKSLRSLDGVKQRTYATEILFECMDGTQRHLNLRLEAGALSGDAQGQLLGVVQDISERKLADAEIEYMAYHDSLTDLPNRESFHDHLNQALAAARRHGRCGAVLFLDIDDFKRINDTLGHEAGDSLLREVATRLKHAVRQNDVVGRDADGGPAQVARIGGDEFTILLTELRGSADAAAVAQRIRNSLSVPAQLGDYEIAITPSIGIAVYPDDARDGETLLKYADIAMYEAKRDGKNGWRFYSSEMNARSLERLQLEAQLRHAVDNNQFELFYQPQVNLATGGIEAFEALIRWRHPDIGLISPASFIPLAEETGMIVPIGEWVIEEANRQALRWREAGHRVRISVNVSSLQFAHGGFLDWVAQVIDKNRVPAGGLEFELTETVIMRNVEETVDILEKIKQMGILLAVDDFGTGYSSLSYLKRFPLDKLKIDRSFVQHLPDDEDDAVIAQAVLVLASRLNLQVVAEGVETEAQCEFLRVHGCDFVQGYLHSPPVPAEEAEAFLLSRQQCTVSSKGDVSVRA